MEEAPGAEDIANRVVSINYMEFGVGNLLGNGSDCGTDGTRALPIDEETAWGAG